MRVAADRARLAGAMVHAARTVLRRAHVVTRAFVLESLGDGVADGGDDRGRPVEPELAGHRERRQPGAMADLVRQAPPEPGDRALVAEEAVQAHRPLGEEGRQLARLDPVGLGSEAVQRWRGQLVTGGHAPDAGLALGALLGEQQRRAAVVEHEPRLTSSRLGRLLGVLGEAPTLHQVDDERQRLEAHEQVLAAPADVEQGEALGLVRRRHDRLQRGERQRHEPGEAATGVAGGQPFGVRLDLGELGHGISGTPCASGRR